MGEKPRCVVCGYRTPTPDTRCTNRCCIDCHHRYCTAGGVTSPGHTLNLEEARASSRRARSAIL